MYKQSDNREVSRRQFLASGLGVAGAAVLSRSALGRSLPRAVVAASANGTISFWDLPWGSPAWTGIASGLVKQYNATHPGNPKVVFQSISWSNEYEVWASAIAAGTPPGTSDSPSWLPFQFAGEGVQPVDKLVARLKANGTAADFGWGTLESYFYQGHYIGIPWAIQPQCLMYRKSILAKAGAEVPTTWAELLAACRKLKKIGVYGLLTEGGPGAFGFQFIFPFLLNNGGGLFNKSQEPDCVTAANLEATEFLQKMAKDGYFDPASVEYTSAQGNAAFGSGRVAMAMTEAGWNTIFSTAVSNDMAVTSPLSSTSGKKGTLYWPEPLVVYKSAGDTAGVEEWLIWYLDAMKVYWEKGVVALTPARKSFASIPAIKNDPFLSVPMNEWMPVAKIDGALSSKGFPALNAMEASTSINTFTQQVIRGTPSAKQCLQALQDDLEIIVSAVQNAR